MTGGSTLASKSRTCQNLFEKVIEESSQALAYADELGRFKTWAGNIGAFQEPRVRSSLEYRLREAPSILNQVEDILDGLKSVLEQVYSISTGNSPNRTTPAPGAEEEFRASLESEGLSEEEIELLMQEFRDSFIEPDCNTTELDELMKTVSGSTTRLFRLSILIRKATPRDRHSKALTASDPYNDQFDISHAVHKFPKLSQNENAWFKQRLGKTMSQRRQVLRYYRDHHQKLARDTSVPKSVMEQSTFKEFEALLATNVLNKPTVALSAHTAITSKPSTENQTKASTLIPSQLELEKDFDDTMSQSSFATNVEKDQNELLQVPDLMAVSKGQDIFECPLCWTIVDIKSQSQWKRHVFHDLRPYVCTAKLCDVKLFPDRRSWFEHELKQHRGLFVCSLCPSRESFYSLDHIEKHLKKHHTLKLESVHIKALAEASRASLTEVPAADCPFCEDWEQKLRELNPSIKSGDIVVVNPQQFQQHVARHMEQMALFALPRSLMESEDGAAIDEDSNAPANKGSRRASQISSFGFIDENVDLSSDYAAGAGEDESDLGDLPLQLVEDSRQVAMIPRVQLRWTMASSQVRKRLRVGDLTTISRPYYQMKHSFLRMKTDEDSRQVAMIPRVQLRWTMAISRVRKRLRIYLIIAKFTAISLAQVRFCIEFSQRRSNDSERQAQVFLAMKAAIRNGNHDLILFILANESNSSLRTLYLNRALIESMATENPSMARWLIELESFDAKDSMMPSILNFAVQMGMVDIVRALLRHDVKIDGPDESEHLPTLHEAVTEGNADILELLLSHRANPNKLNDKAESPLLLAIRQEKYVLATMLLFAGADPNLQAADGDTALHQATGKGSLSSVKHLLEFGARVNEQDFRGRTALHIAALGGYVDILEELIDLGADVNKQDNTKSTALHFAAAIVKDNERLRMVSLLIQQGIDVDIVDINGRSSFEYALNHPGLAVHLLHDSSSKNPRSTSSMQIEEWESQTNDLSGLFAESNLLALCSAKRRLFGFDHPSTLQTHHQLASFYLSENRFRDARRVFNGVLETRKRSLGPQHLDTLRTASGLLCALQSGKRFIEAELIYEQYFGHLLSSLEPNDPMMSEIQKMLQPQLEQATNTESPKVLLTDRPTQSESQDTRSFEDGVEKPRRTVPAPLHRTTSKLLGPQRPLEKYDLPCPFPHLECIEVFSSDQFEEWRKHVLGHFAGYALPAGAACPYCEQVISNNDPKDCWDQWLVHICNDHHALEGAGRFPTPDMQLYRYFYDIGAMSLEDWQALQEKQSNPITRASQIVRNMSRRVVSLSQNDAGPSRLSDATAQSWRPLVVEAASKSKAQSPELDSPFIESPSEYSSLTVSSMRAVRATARSYYAADSINSAGRRITTHNYERGHYDPAEPRSSDIRASQRHRRPSIQRGKSQPEHITPSFLTHSGSGQSQTTSVFGHLISHATRAGVVIGSSKIGQEIPRLMNPATDRLEVQRAAIRSARETESHSRSASQDSGTDSEEAEPVLSATRTSDDISNRIGDELSEREARSRDKERKRMSF